MRVRDEWGSIYIASGRKTHLMDGCPYHTDSHRKIDASKIPESHTDLCSWCKERFGNWREGLQSDDKGRCDRCGDTTTNVRYCRECQTHVERMKARKR